MKKVISASRRTDIPAYYLKWFIRAIESGQLTVRNPMYPANSIKVDLRPETVSWIVFWSRNYGPFLKQAEVFDAYNLFFHFTVLNESSELEQASIGLERALSQVAELAKRYGPKRIIWRYDPIVIWNDGLNMRTNYQQKEFEWLCREMAALGIQSCYFSFATAYRKFESRFKRKFPGCQIIAGEHAAKQNILSEMKLAANSSRIDLYSCCNEAIATDGIYKGHCIDGSLLNSLADERVSVAKKPSRSECGCTKAIDIGDYEQQPCPTGCIYCYANPVWQPDSIPKRR